MHLTLIPFEGCAAIENNCFLSLTWTKQGIYPDESSGISDVQPTHKVSNLSTYHFRIFALNT